MPPSGYNPTATNGIETFFLGIGRDLRRENSSDLTAGLTKEQRALRLSLAKKQFTRKEVEGALLRLTLTYYDAVEQAVAEGTHSDIGTALELLPSVLSAKIGRLHLLPDGTLNQR